MKKIYLIVTLITALFLSACNDGNGYVASTATIALQNCEIYTDLLAGDTLVHDEDNTTIKTVFNVDGSQKVCILSGAAHIER